MTKKEAKLLKATKKLEKATKKYLKKITEVDEVIQGLPVQLTRCYNLEEDYFAYVPRIASLSVKLELLHTKIEQEIDSKEKWMDLEDDFDEDFDENFEIDFDSIDSYRNYIGEDWVPGDDFSPRVKRKDKAKTKRKNR